MPCQKVLRKHLYEKQAKAFDMLEGMNKIEDWINDLDERTETVMNDLFCGVSSGESTSRAGLH